jgi:hypothetical protein
MNVVHANRWTDRRDEANNRFSKFCEKRPHGLALKLHVCMMTREGDFHFYGNNNDYDMFIVFINSRRLKHHLVPVLCCS